MADFGFGSGTPGVTADQVQSQIMGFLSDQMPMSEAVAGMPGNAGLASRANHAHARLTSATVQSLNSSGEATITFTRTFPSKPAMACLLHETADAQPVSFKVKSFTQDDKGNYVGCTVKGYRSALLPTLSGIALLTGLVNALASFNVFSGNASGAEFSCIALQVSG